MVFAASIDSVARSHESAAKMSGEAPQVLRFSLLGIPVAVLVDRSDARISRTAASASAFERRDVLPV
jgi:hypothetical protein